MSLTSEILTLSPCRCVNMPGGLASCLCLYLCHCLCLFLSMQLLSGRLAVCLRMTVSQLVKPHRASCLLGQLNKVLPSFLAFFVCSIILTFLLMKFFGLSSNTAYIVKHLTQELNYCWDINAVTLVADDTYSIYDAIFTQNCFSCWCWRNYCQTSIYLGSWGPSTSLWRNKPFPDLRLRQWAQVNGMVPFFKSNIGRLSSIVGSCKVFLQHFERTEWEQVRPE